MKSEFFFFFSVFLSAYWHNQIFFNFNMTLSGSFSICKELWVVVCEDQIVGPSPWTTYILSGIRVWWVICFRILHTCI